MVKVTEALLYCKEYLTGLSGLQRKARHPTETNAEKKNHKQYILGKLPLKQVTFEAKFKTETGLL